MINMYGYLSDELLNEIEESISELHTQFSSIYGLEESKLKLLETGALLGGKTLHLTFPWESYEKITKAAKTNILTTNNGTIDFYKKDNENIISYSYNGDNPLYAKKQNEINNYINYIRYKFPEDFGKITSLNECDFFDCIKISSNENLPLEYSKKIWTVNEPVYLQEIDRIEQGIQTIADCLYEPLGYESKEWTKVGYFGIEELGGGLEQKPIREEDITRIKNNIELLMNVLKEENTIWNIFSTVTWNEISNLEWSE